MSTPSIIRTSTADLYDAYVMKNYSRAALTLMWRVSAGPALKALVRHAREAFRPMRSASEPGREPDREPAQAPGRGRRPPVTAGTP